MELREIVMGALRTALSFSQTLALQDDKPLNAEDWDPDDISAEERDRLLLGVANDLGLSEHDKEMHRGLPAIAADRATHVVISGFLQQHLPHARVVGEEATEGEWEVAIDSPEGTTIAWSDAIDGSLPYDTLSFGFSTNLILFRRTRGGLRLLLAAVVNSTGYVALYDRDGGDNVYMGSLHEGSLRPITQPRSQDVREGTVATVGALWKDRSRMRALFDNEDLTVFTTGGAPAAIGLIIGRLSALVCRAPQTLHDAAYLPILAALGIPIFTRDRILVGLPDVLAYFERVALTIEDRTDTPVPPFVAVRDPKSASTYLDAIEENAGE